MKAGYRIEYGDRIHKPSVISVANYAPLNLVLFLYWKTTGAVSSNNHVIGVWHVKWKHK